MANNQSMTAMVEYQVRTATTSMDTWLETWAIRAEDARVGEPETTAYAALVSEQDSSQVLVFERYAAGDASVQAHIARPAHTALTDTMGERNMTRRRVMSMRANDLPDYGWWARPEVSTTLVQADAVLTVLGMRFANDASRQQFVTLSSEHADYCLANEPETLIYSAGLAAADADRGLDIRRGDLIFYMLCSNPAAVQRHADDAQHIALGGRLQAAGALPEITFNHTYRSSGHGFLWGHLDASA